MDNSLDLLLSIGTSGKESACQCRKHETQVLSLGREDSPRVGNGNPLPGKSHEQGSLAGYSP